jgi:monovalent cation/proton antiporter MnhG/PhaG subunit
MTVRHIIAEVLLWLGVGFSVLAALGALVLRTAYDRLHLPAVASLGTLLTAIGVMFEKSFSLIGDESLIVAVFLVIASPILTVATARAVRIAERGDWRIQEGEDIEVEEG